MTRKISAQDGPDTNRAEHGGRQGTPGAVIVSVDDCLKSIAPENEALRASRDLAARRGSDLLSIEEIDSEVDAFRKERRAKAEADR
jgi:hypothetical protein